MSSYMAKPSEVERKWYIIDATDKPLGRVASAAASILEVKINQHIWMTHLFICYAKLQEELLLSS